MKAGFEGGGNDGGEVGSFLHLTKMHLKPFLDTFIFPLMTPYPPTSSTIELKLKKYFWSFKGKK